MKRFIVFVCVVLLILSFCPIVGQTQNAEEVKTSVDNLVGKHYMDGIPYEVAHSLDPAALPYLFELLGNPDKKPYWVNIVVTIGFMENPSAVEPLISFLEDTQGEVDSFTFRALLSVPYALGCIASNGNAIAFQYLAENVEAPLNQRVRWSYQGKPVAELIAEQSVMGLAVSGRSEARSLLLDLKEKITQKTGPEAHALRGDNINQAFTIMNRITTEGRAAVLNPQREDEKGGL